MTAFLWLALGRGIPHCNSECAYEVYSPCSLRQARSYCSTYTHPESLHIASRCAIRDDGRSGQSSSTRARCYQIEGDSAVYGRAGDARSKPPSVISAPMRHWQCLTCCHGIDGEKSDRNDIVTDWRQCSVG
ncbi:hypothetical protein M405DRAFT_813500 [Rhizopogon salebrosus TDB-379]|nr:hypothetical protein M405DRAFT_813500 [Rhizopogon salebrosus TDB-379]